MVALSLLGPEVSCQNTVAALKHTSVPHLAAGGAANKRGTSHLGFKTSLIAFFLGLAWLAIAIICQGCVSGPVAREHRVPLGRGGSGTPQDTCCLGTVCAGLASSPEDALA